MNNLHNVLITFLMIYSFNVQADEIPRPMHNLFFNSQLIVEAKIVSHTNDDYTIQILDVHHDHQIGTKVGDYIKIKRAFNVIKSSDKIDRKSIEDRRSGIVFLTKSPSGWYVGSFCLFYDEFVTMNFSQSNCKISGSSDEIKTQIQEYFKEFKLDESGKITGKKTAKQVKKADLSQLVLIQYAQLYRFTIHPSVYERINCQESISKPSE